jgi:hypothetical protein
MKKILVFALSLNLISTTVLGMESIVKRENEDKAVNEDNVINYKTEKKVAGKQDSSFLIKTIEVEPVVNSIIQKLLTDNNCKQACKTVYESYENCGIDQQGKVYVDGKEHAGMQKFVDYICSENSTISDTFDIIYMAYWLKTERELTDLQKATLFILDHKLRLFYARPDNFKLSDDVVRKAAEEGNLFVRKMRSKSDEDEDIKYYVFNPFQEDKPSKTKDIVNITLHEPDIDYSDVE